LSELTVGRVAPEAEGSVKQHNQRRQRTLRRSAEVTGLGYLTGESVRVRFCPASPGSGVVFVRTDLTPAVVIPALVDQVTGTARRTTLGHAPAAVSLVEHVLAALAGLRIDNCRVELDASEPPGLDGSAQGFTEALVEAGTALQAAWRPIWGAEKVITLRQGDSTLTLHPPRPGEMGLRVSYYLDYGHFSQPGRQTYSQTVTPTSFIEELAGCRTFVLEAEVDLLRRQGIGLRITQSDLLVFGKDGPIDNALRFANEPARHKVLDILGDLALLGFDLCGHVVAYRSGHPLNVEMARTLRRIQASVSEGSRRPAGVAGSLAG
jgi:UDP-3-O-acyl N-acetylglucosamine deacetylase